jgi:UDP-N-acetylmuramate dehydrogenase
MLWPKNFSKKIKANVNLGKLTSFKIGGPARYFFEPADLKELAGALAFAKKAGLGIFVLGAGSNILISDAGVEGLVIKLSHANFKRVSHQGSCIMAGSGLKLSQLVSCATKHSLSGIEFLAGIPGSLGGSLAGNAGAWGYSIGSLVKQLGVMDYSGKLKILSANQLKFGYRKSNLSKYIIIWAKLKLSCADKKTIALQIKQYLTIRKSTQNSRLPNAGCVFKNPLPDSAGRLIDESGLKGKSRGKAQVCLKHANFILNIGGARFRDVLGLMDLMQKKVKAKFKVNLEPEIKIWK